MNDKHKSIYDLKLHENTFIESHQYDVLRVPGGWIYQRYDCKNDGFFGEGVFIPFDNSFQVNRALENLQSSKQERNGI